MKERLTTKNLSYKRLHELLMYYPKTGNWYWKIFRNHLARVGDLAGHLDKKDGYRKIRIGKKMYLSSRLAFLYMEGYFPENQVGHKNRIRHDDRWNNLREVTAKCNVRNSGISKNNKSEITGVSWHKKAKKWMAEIWPNKKGIYLGIYSTKIEAAEARWEAEKKYGWPNCNTESTAYQYIQKSIIKKESR